MNDGRRRLYNMVYISRGKSSDTTSIPRSRLLFFPLSHISPSDRFKKIVHGYIDDFNAKGKSTYLLHRTLNHKNPDMFPAGNLNL